MSQNVAPHVAGKMLHYATLEKFVAALQKVEPSSTSYNDCGNKKFREMFVPRVTKAGYHNGQTYDACVRPHHFCEKKMQPNMKTFTFDSRFKTLRQT